MDSLWMTLRWLPKIAFFSIIGVFVYLFIYVVVVFIDYTAHRSEIQEFLLVEKNRLLTGHGVPAAVIDVYDRKNNLIGKINSYNASNLLLNHCQKMEWLNRATVASEDQSFYQHYGINIRGILRAIKTNILSLSFQEGGGSITQQLARNMFTSAEKNLYRKLFETYIAFQIEMLMDKEEILCSYLNKIYMGEGQIGAQQASWFYFNKAPEDLSIAEAAMIVGLFPGPSYYSPLRNPKLAMKKQQQVLASMQSIDPSISDEEINQSLQALKREYGIQNQESAGNIGNHNVINNIRYNLAPTVNDYIYNFIIKNLPVEQLTINNRLVVHTTINLNKQRIATKTIRMAIQRERKKTLLAYRKSQKKINRTEKIVQKIQGVFLAINANNGEILAVEGGKSPLDGGLSIRPWQMQRQPGSSIKGFLYAVALDEDIYRAKSLVYDEPVKYGNYEPKNWNNRYLGTVPLAKAVASSINSVAIKTLEQIGVGYFRQKLGVSIGLSRADTRNRFPNNLSLALGSGELTPLELAQLYLAIVNKGVTLKPILVKSITNDQGRIIYKSAPRRSRKILHKRSCSEALWLLTQVFNPDLVGTASFIGKRQKKTTGFLNFPIAGKTGSVQLAAKTRRNYGISGYRDAWFVGLHPEEVNVVWLGNDEGAPIKSGGANAAAVWSNYAQRALQKTKSNFVGKTSWPSIYTLDWYIHDTINKPPPTSKETTNSIRSQQAGSDFIGEEEFLNNIDTSSETNEPDNQNKDQPISSELPTSYDSNEELEELEKIEQENKNLDGELQNNNDREEELIRFPID